MSNQENKLFGHPIEILAFTRGQSDGLPVALVELRVHPEENTEIVGLMLSQQQCVRIRDTMNEFLNDKESWLYLPKAKQTAMQIQEE
jgi:hypothetical protein